MAGENIVGTRSNIYVETEPGTYLGTYCHYDGYPKHMIPTLSAMSKDELLGHILMSMTHGGIRILDGQGATEYLDDANCDAVVMTSPSISDWGAEYVYIKLHDGGVAWRDCFDSSNGWNDGNQWHDPSVDWPLTRAIS